MYRRGTVISDVLTPSVVTCNENDPLNVVLKKLRKYNILSLPVRDMEKSNFIGRIGVWDIANLIVNSPTLTMNDRICDFWPRAIGVTKEDEKALKYGPGGLESIYTFNINTPLEVLFDTMTKGVHRVLVTHRVDGHENLLRNLSQSDLIRSLYCQENLLDEDFKKRTLNDLNAIVRPVKHVKMMDKMGQTLSMMIENGIDAVPVTENDSTRIKTILSFSDLRGAIDPLLMSSRNKSISDFLWDNYGNYRRPTTISGTDTIEEAMKRMLTKRVHRLWEVDENGNVKGVLSMTDILRVISEGLSHSK